MLGILWSQFLQWTVAMGVLPVAGKKLMLTFVAPPSSFGGVIKELAMPVISANPLIVLAVERNLI